MHDLALLMMRLSANILDAGQLIPVGIALGLAVLAVLGAVVSAAGEGAAVVAVLHDLNLAAAYADQVSVLDAGRVRACGTPREMFTGALLSATYGEPMEVIDHPLRDCPLVLTAGRHDRPTPG